MDSKHILGYVTLGILLAAVAFAAYLWVSDHAGGSDESEDETPTVSYSMEISPMGTTGYMFSVTFHASDTGWLRIHLGDDVLLNSLGDPVEHRWLWEESDTIGWALKFEPGQDYEYIESNLWVEFPPSFSVTPL